MIFLNTSVHTTGEDTKVIKSKLQVFSNDFKLYCIKNVHLGKKKTKHFMLMCSRSTFSIVDTTSLFPNLMLG